MKSIISSTLSIFRRLSGVWVLVLLVIFCAGVLYLRGLPITEPFIFGDESTYFSFARHIFQHKNLSSFTQYGPLYPALISLVFYFKNVILSYNIVRILNIIIYFSAVIPGYLLSQKLFTNKWLKLLLPFCLILSPFSAFVYVVWADPLYFCLFYWSCFLLYCYVNKPSLVKGILLGFCLSSLYYTKPGAGLVVQIAAFLSLVIYSILLWKSQTTKIKLLTCLIIFICLVVNLPWVLHYYHLGVSIIGYAVVTNNIHSVILHEGYSTLAFNTIRSFFYQFSYVFIGSWGLIGIGLALLYKKWQQLNSNERIICLFAMLCIFGLMALSAAGMAGMAGLDYRMPNGRYLSVLLPLICTLSLHFLFKPTIEKKLDRSLFFILFIVIFITTSITIIAAPLYTLSPFAFTTMPELSPIIYLINHGHVIWHLNIEAPTLLLRWSVALSFALFAVCLLLIRNWARGPLLATILVAIGFGLSSMAQIHGLSTIGTSGGLTKIYNYFIKYNIDSSQIAFDKNMDVQFLSSFWLDQVPHYISYTEIKNNSVAKPISYFVSCSLLPLKNQLYTSGNCTIYKIERG